MGYIATRFCQRLGSYDVLTAATNETGRLDKVIKFIDGVVKPIFEFMTLAEGTPFGWLATLGRAGLSLPFFDFTVTVGKNLMAPEFFAKTLGWWVNDFRNGLTLEKITSTISMPLLQMGNLADSLLFLESMGLASFASASEMIGKVPVFGNALLGVGLKGVKFHAVMISSILGIVGVGIFLGHRYFIRDNNGVTPNQIEAENEKQFANFFNSLSKAVVVFSIERLAKGAPFPYIKPILFVGGLVLGVTNLWKYVMPVQDNREKTIRLQERLFANHVCIRAADRDDLANHAFV